MRTAVFSLPCFEVLQESSLWHELVSAIASSEDLSVLHAKCEHVKSEAVQLDLNPLQAAKIGELKAMFPDDNSSCAIRSSSPEEDLVGASFAGQYETILDVLPEHFELSIRACFVSSLDARVMLYKQQMGFDLTPRIAVVVQQLVHSESAGVAFSINPATNDFDEVLINSAFGLGEALVSGEITPDSIVANKASGETIDYRIGTKDEPSDGRHEHLRSLSDMQIRELVRLVRRIEERADEPVDIEWAFSDGELFVLQSRPVTSYVPLHKDLQTSPDEIRHLYIDGFLTDGITMSSAISPMSSSVFEALIDGVFRWLAGLNEGELSLESMGVYLSGGRMYIDFNLFATVYGKQEKFLEQAERMNPFYVAMFTSTEIDRYDRSRPTGWTTFAMIRWGLRILWHSKSVVTKLISAWWQGPRFKSKYDASVDRFEEYITREIDLSLIHI